MGVLNNISEIEGIYENKFYWTCQFIKKLQNEDVVFNKKKDRKER